MAVIDRIAPWLPVLLAVSANSPFYLGRDTAYASWRSQVWARWPSAGPTERFGSVEGYREVGRRLIATGAARDAGMLYFDARLSADHPTVEVRVADVCTSVDDGVLVAALVRALVAHAAEQGSGPQGTADDPPWRSELLRAAHWRAARQGLTGALVSPLTGELAPAREVLDSLVTEVRDQLEAYRDLALAEDGVQRVLAGGGATRQRAAYERSGGELTAVVDDLVERTDPR
ncbi:glutamate-cysteine ligase family protein [Nocardioides sp. TF02-7]|uniref:carboxylate-amine ligase n=1 Tax=Nocardioides sp. TF02-7 TaxID=2917724 RepID=UPI001F053870|nr:glutamate-cysteine ligase family protein [Nocardioides sp. TF02-7]UMG94498.1 glutamate-cysteine ligase family protein [Nocardioides sp. TF02-7]